jgi:GNAT superfamily N-acetyltransferase
MPAACIAQATLEDLPDLVPLFDAYRVFYQQPPDTSLAHAFLHERLALRESVILLARSDTNGTACGFTQMYPCFSSVAAQRLWILNDLFVTPQARGGGIARALLAAAERHARDCGAIRLVLSTAANNRGAQKLYESCGWVRDHDWFYQRPLSQDA